MYTQNGYMNTTMTNNDSTVPLLGDGTVAAQWPDATDAEVLRLARPMVTYSGPFDVEENNDEIWYEFYVCENARR